MPNKMVLSHRAEPNYSKGIFSIHSPRRPCHAGWGVVNYLVICQLCRSTAGTPWDHRPKKADMLLTPVPPAHRREAWKIRTLLKFEREDFLTLSTRTAVRFTCFEFSKGRWVEHVSLLLLSGRVKKQPEKGCWLRLPTWQGESPGILLWDKR